MSEKAKLDITQVEEERKKTLELILIVLLLGLLLNFVASAAYDRFQARGQASSLLWISVATSVFLLVTFVRIGVLRPARLHTEIPVVLFYDTNAGTLSVPTRIHCPPKRFPGVDLRPFPILCRLYLDEYNKYIGIDQSDPSGVMSQQDTLTFLLQYVFIAQYTREHIETWAPMHGVTSGPFLTGYATALPGQAYDRAELASRSGNPFLEMHAEGWPLQLPPRSKVEFPSFDTLVFSNPSYRAEIRVAMAAGQPMGYWKLGRRITSSWYQELSSDFSNTYAYLFNLRIEVSLKLGFWRIFAEDWLPPRLRKTALQDICEWVNSWISSARDFFDWVNEDVSTLPDTEQAVLIDEATLTYQRQLQGTPRITFQS